MGHRHRGELPRLLSRNPVLASKVFDLVSLSAGYALGILIRPRAVCSSDVGRSSRLAIQTFMLVVALGPSANTRCSPASKLPKRSGSLFGTGG